MKKSGGLSLIELLVTLAVVSVSFASAAPSLQYVVQKNRTSSELNTLLAFVTYTRKLAIMHGQTSILCPSRDTINCDNRDWTSQLVAFVDNNNNKKRDDAEPIQRLVTIDTLNSISWKASGHARYLRFNQYGHGVTFGSFYHCRKDYPEKIKRIAVSRAGRARLHPDLNKDGASDSVDTGSIACS